MHLLLALALLSAPSNTPDDCEKLWEDTVAAAAPDLDPSDDLRKSYLSRERANLEKKCLHADRGVLMCPSRASKLCSARFPQPPDGGRALGLAACVWPEVQACAQAAFLHASEKAVDALLADLEAGKLSVPKSGVLALSGESALLSVRGEALVQRAGKGFWLALITRRAGARVEAAVYASPSASPIPPAPELQIAGVSGHVIGRLGAATLIDTAK